MMLSRVSFKQLVAIILPLSFVWTFAACVTICSEHVTQSQDEHMVGSAVEMCDSSDSCPITNAPVSLLPERVSPAKQVYSDQQTVLTLSARLVREALLNCSHTLKPLPSSSPPLEWLSVLRI